MTESRKENCKPEGLRSDLIVNCKIDAKLLK